MLAVIASTPTVKAGVDTSAVAQVFCFFAELTEHKMPGLGFQHLLPKVAAEAQHDPKMVR